MKNITFSAKHSYVVFNSEEYEEYFIEDDIIDAVHLYASWNKISEVRSYFAVYIIM